MHRFLVVIEIESVARLTFLRKSMCAERSVSGVAENRVSGSGAVSGRPRSGSGGESGCHKNRLERWAGNRPLTLRSHALHVTWVCKGSQFALSLYPSKMICVVLDVLLSPSSPFHWLQNTWPWITLNDHFALNSVLCWYVWSSEPGFRSLATLKLVVNVVGEL